MSIKQFGGPTEPSARVADGCVSRLLVQSAELKLDLVNCDAGFGSSGEMQAAAVTEADYVLSGRFEARIGKETRVVAAGESFLTLVGQLRGVACIESGSYVAVTSIGGKDQGAGDPTGNPRKYYFVE